METALWIDANRAFVGEAVDVLAEHMGVRASVSLLYRHRRPVAQTGPLAEEIEEEPAPTEVRASHAYSVPSVHRPGWQVLRATAPPVPAPAQTVPVAPVVKAPPGTAWNKVAQREVMDASVTEEEAVEEAEDEVWVATQAYQDAVFDDETHNNELLLEMLEGVRDSAERHDACHGVHSQAFVDALGNCVGA